MDSNARAGRAAARPQPFEPDADATHDGFSPRDILASIGEVAYSWSIADDRLSFSDNACAVLRVEDAAALASGRGFARFVDGAKGRNRYDVVMSGRGADTGDGVGYQTQYGFVPPGADQAPLWLEDTGRWFAGTDGRPERAHGVIRVINERHEREERLAFLSRFDELTGLANRRALAERLEQTLSEAKSARVTAGFMLIAIDNLSMINDAYGFDVADEMIAALANRLKGRLRGCDTLGRISGNKFGVVLARCNEPELVIAADRLLHSVRDHVVQTHRGPIAATVSIGGVIGPRYARDGEEAMFNAHEALAAAKKRGPSSFVAFHHIRERSAERNGNMRLANEIVAGLNEDRFVFAYQPVVEIATGRPAFYECLLRLRQPDGSLMRAGQFIPTVEKLGLVRLIDHRVLEMALADLAASPDLTLSLNISGASAASPEWLSSLTAAFRREPALAARVIVEITETLAIQNVAETARFVGALRDFGVRIAIDDFGAGYTSFRNLRLIRVDMVKIDGAYVENLAKSRDDQVFVRTLVDLARNFGLATVAEWVRDAESVEMLKGFGVDYVQGAYSGMPKVEKPWENAAAARVAKAG